MMMSSDTDEYESACDKENEEPPFARVDHVHVKAASRLRFTFLILELINTKCYIIKCDNNINFNN